MSAERKVALAGFRILELADPKVHYGAKLLADLGAEVIKVERPGGDASRRVGPFKEDVPHPERGLYFLNFNTSKKSVTLDLEAEEGWESFRKLARTADAVLEGFPPGYLRDLGLDYPALSELHPGIVLTSVTGFGQSGPYHNYKAPDIVCFAMSGMMYIMGDPERPPLAAPYEQAYQMASVHAAYATLLALYNRLASGRGQHIDISIQEVVASKPHPQLIARYHSYAEIQGRIGSQAPGGVPAAIYPCKDGYVSFAVFNDDHWKRFREWIGNPEELSDPMWDYPPFRHTNVDVTDLFIIPFTQRYTKAELVVEGQARHIAVAPVNTPAEFIENPHTQARGFFVEAEHSEIGHYRCTGPPYRLSVTPWRIHRPAPTLGQHNREVLGGLEEALEALSHSRDASLKRDKPLFAGVRVIDFTHRVAGPFGTRLLADYGAEVIRIDSSRITERTRLGQQLERNKLCISIDMKREEGREVVRRLIRISDVVTENFSLGVMQRWGLDYPRLKEIKPDIIMMSMQGLGRTGPHREYVTWGQNLVALTGLSYLWAHPDGAPSSGRLMNAPLWAYGDFAAPAHGVVALLAALHYRTRTGEGQFIDLAQVEAVASLLGTAYLDYLINGRVPRPMGNRSPDAAPYSCYRCRGYDAWCVIAVYSQEEWLAFCQEIGNPEWARDARFAAKEGRLQNVDELDRRVEEWTRQHTPHQVMRILQKVGVPAAAVQNAEDVYFDYHLRSRGFLVEVEHPAIGRQIDPGLPIRLSETPGAIRRGAPLLGEHNDYIYGELLGLSTRERQNLLEEGVLV